MNILTNTKTSFIQLFFYNSRTVLLNSTYNWYKHFQEGHEDVENKCHESCTSTINKNIKKVKKIMYNHRITIKEVADVGILFSSSPSNILDVLGMKCVAVKFVKMLTSLLEINIILFICIPL